MPVKFTWLIRLRKTKKEHSGISRGGNEEENLLAVSATLLSIMNIRKVSLINNGKNHGVRGRDGYGQGAFRIIRARTRRKHLASRWKAQNKEKV